MDSSTILIALVGFLDSSELIPRLDALLFLGAGTVKQAIAKISTLNTGTIIFIQTALFILNFSSFYFYGQKRLQTYLQTPTPLRASVYQCEHSMETLWEKEGKGTEKGGFFKMTFFGKNH
ncbi:MAG: hypothetical protein HOO88_03485 [Kiritimatiellaceae bacterium]|nr:hypothetical protein [Kiritimatiellaceae bacterium]